MKMALVESDTFYNLCKYYVFKLCKWYVMSIRKLCQLPYVDPLPVFQFCHKYAHSMDFDLNAMFLLVKWNIYIVYLKAMYSSKLILHK